MARNLEWKYGGSVLVEYIDLGHDQNQKDYPEVIEAVSQYDLEFPLVAIDGELRMAGGINFGMIYEAIEKGRSEDAADEREEGE